MKDVCGVFVVDEKENVGVLFSPTMTAYKVYQSATDFNWKALNALGVEIVTIALESLPWKEGEYDTVLRSMKEYCCDMNALTNHIKAMIKPE